MSTFKELSNKLKALDYQRAILNHVIDMIEESFLPSEMYHEPKLKLLTEDKVTVPTEAFAEVVDDLYSQLENVAEKRESILDSSLTKVSVKEE